MIDSGSINKGQVDNFVKYRKLDLAYRIVYKNTP